MQSFPVDGDFFLAQLFIHRPHQGQGIGTEVMRQLIAEAAHAGQAVCLDVVKINPALRLYQRLGFRIVGQEETKFYMKRDLRSSIPRPDSARLVSA